MHAGCEKREGKMKILVREHPLVILIVLVNELRIGSTSNLQWISKAKKNTMILSVVC